MQHQLQALYGCKMLIKRGNITTPGKIQWKFNLDDRAGSGERCPFGYLFNNEKKIRTGLLWMQSGLTTAWLPAAFAGRTGPPGYWSGR